MVQDAPFAFLHLLHKEQFALDTNILCNNSATSEFESNLSTQTRLPESSNLHNSL